LNMTRKILFLLAIGMAAVAQLPVKFEATSQLVVVNVAAKSKSGQPIEGLTASDFTVTEDGKSQQIRVFEYQRLEEAVLPAPGLSARSETTVAGTVARIAPAKPGEVKYKDRRLLVLFFDQAGMPVADQHRAQQAALRFLNSQMTQADVVSVMTYETSLKVLQDFTSDRDLLVKVIKSISIGDIGQSNGSTGDDSEGDTGAAYTQDDSEFNIFNTDRKLAALESAAKMLGSLPEKKALVYFASGMTRTGTDNQAQLRATINAAIRGNVSFYPVDARGLVATAPLGDKGIAGRARDVLREFAAHHAVDLPGAAGNAPHAGFRQRRQGAARSKRSRVGDSAGAEGRIELLHTGLLQLEHRPRWTLSADQSPGEQRADGEAGLSERVFRIEGVSEV
jgi:VWFA-related protein